MATPVLNLCPYALDICATRGDSTPMTFQMQDAAGNDLTITGRTYIFTVNTEEEPTDSSNEVFNLTGTVSTPNVTFAPTTANMNQTPADYFYDLQEDNAGDLRTVAKGKFEIKQDITK